mmetsp:Transcript_24955/g.61837  ORF Transcript_24955/g.61837 Transcript_24955/m.61837 type:complete len:317 (-) Transcript_24955:81-1031(-)
MLRTPGSARSALWTTRSMRWNGLSHSVRLAEGCSTLSNGSAGRRKTQLGSSSGRSRSSTVLRRCGCARWRRLSLQAWKESKEAQLKEKRARRTASMPACASATSEAQLSEAAPTHSGQNSKQTQPSTPGQQPPAPGSTQSEQSEVHVALLIGQQPVKSSLKKRKQVTWAQDDGDDAGQKAGSAKSARAKAAKSSAGASQPSPRVNFDAVLMPVPGRARLMTVARFADENDVGLSEVIEIEEPRGALGAWDAPLHGQRAGLIGDAHCSGKSSKANEGEKELHEEGRLDGEARVSASCGATALLPPERWQGNLSGLLA